MKIEPHNVIMNHDEHKCTYIIMLTVTQYHDIWIAMQCNLDMKMKRLYVVTVANKI